MDLQELEGLLIQAQISINTDDVRNAVGCIVAAKLMVQAEMARIGRIRAGELQDGDERRVGE